MPISAFSSKCLNFSWCSNFYTTAVVLYHHSGKHRYFRHYIDSIWLGKITVLFFKNCNQFFGASLFLPDFISTIISLLQVSFLGYHLGSVVV